MCIRDRARREEQALAAERERELLRRSYEEMRVAHARNEIADLMVSACPRCRRGLVRGEGCAALTCPAPCGAHLCLFCLGVFPNAAACHAHLGGCAWNPNRNGREPYWVTAEQEAAGLRAKRGADVRAYLERMPADEFRAKVVRDATVAGILRALGVE